jgi:hypothetical protein
MLNHLLSILGLATLTALWVVFQLWLKKQDPDRDERCIGCGSGCKKRDSRNNQASDNPGNVRD